MPAFAKNRYSDMSPTFRTSYCQELEQLEPKDHTHQFASRCAIAFVRVKHRNDLILADFNLAVGWSIRQTAKFNSPPNFPAIRYTMIRTLPFPIAYHMTMWISYGFVSYLSSKEIQGRSGNEAYVSGPPPHLRLWDSVPPTHVYYCACPCNAQYNAQYNMFYVRD